MIIHPPAANGDPEGDSERDREGDRIGAPHELPLPDEPPDWPFVEQHAPPPPYELPGELPYGFPLEYPSTDVQGELWGAPHPLMWSFLQDCPKRGRVHALSSVFQINNWLIAKCGPDVHDGELLALLVLGQRGFPVPRVLAWYKEPETGYLLILMQYVNGARLDQVWSGMADAEQRSVLEQLQVLMGRLRSVTADWIGALDTSPVKDHIFAGLPVGRCIGQADFFSDLALSIFLREPVDSEGGDDDQHLASALVRNTHRNALARMPLTHGDLVPRNILVGKDFRIVAITDWSQAGFYPESWEFVKACWNPARTEFSQADVAAFLQPHWAELGNVALVRKLGACAVCPRDGDCLVNPGRP